ncbi:MAG: hypothetical protein ACI8T1_001282 [Verrucomicrobiales bacterium]|jgi:hypothetical protein
MTQQSCVVCVAMMFAITVQVMGQEAPFRINELISVNVSRLRDIEKYHSDWIEIQNISGETQNLVGWHLSDDPDDPTKWTSPSKRLDPNSSLVIFASVKINNSIFQIEINTNFTLGRFGGYLSLADPEGNVVQEYIYPNQWPDFSYGLNEAN